MSDILLSLPWPPSVNRIWRHVTINGKPRVLLSREGRSYRAVVVRHCQVKRVSGLYLAGRLSVQVVAEPPNRVRRDLDNLMKATLDALTHAGVWQDDSQIDRLLVERGPICKPGRLQVAISSISGASEWCR